ncbi:MAG: transglycosylase SLT domain-containing protein [Deltaproteobacteria bacterium]|nr:transglycosylase SLT domain-containing protein [Deltaproteobacteria bacterium]
MQRGLAKFASICFIVVVTASSDSHAQRAPGSTQGESAAVILGRARELVRKGQSEAALKRLEGDWGQQLKQAQAEPAARLAKARILESLNRQNDAMTEYSKALEKRSPFETQLRFAAGRLYAKLDKPELARESFYGVLNADRKDVPSAVRVRTILELGKVMAKQAEAKPKIWRDVVKLLQPALKASRGHEVHAEYLYLLLRAKRAQGTSDCRLARDLYAKYPAASEIAAWGPLMPLNKVDDKKLSCSATVKDIQTRLRRLQLLGQIDRALKEIRELRSKAVFDVWTLDSFEIGAMLAQGQNDEAMKLLMQHSEMHRGRPQFWNLFGRITSRTGDFTASSGAYYKAYELAPRGRAASDALFNSAFASYQMQDYDGAEKTFSMLSTKYGSAKIARDARWHLAWMSYLRGDYETALNRWQSLLKERTRRRATRGDSTSPDRIQYWSAMAMLRLGKETEAVTVLRSLLKDPSIDYYAVLAWYRLKSIPSVKLTDAEARIGFRQNVSEQIIKETIVAETLASEGDVADTSESSDDENTDPTAESAEESSEADATAAAPEAAPEAVLVEPVIELGAVRDPALQRRLDRVRLLYAIGMNEETRWELQNLDSQVRHPQDRRVMMTELHRMGRWDRSSTLGELAFSGPRLRGGLDGARDLWEFAYPKAWVDYVVPSAKSAGVEEELVWSIMRAESQYRAEARSPVGATGLMQIMPFTGEKVSSQLLGKDRFQPTDLQDPEVNVRFGARYLQRLVEKFGGSLPLVAAGYNAGPHRVQNWLRGFGALRMDEFIEHIPFVETRNYVKKVSRNYQIYRLLYRDDRGSLGWLVKPVGVTPDSGPNALEVW